MVEIDHKKLSEYFAALKVASHTHTHLAVKEQADAIESAGYVDFFFGNPTVADLIEACEAAIEYIDSSDNNEDNGYVDPLLKFVFIKIYNDANVFVTAHKAGLI